MLDCETDKKNITPDMKGEVAIVITNLCQILDLLVKQRYQLQLLRVAYI